MYRLPVLTYLVAFLPFVFSTELSCIDAVSLSRLKSNRACKTLCETGASLEQMKRQRCGLAGYNEVSNGRIEPKTADGTGPCHMQWIYGYSEPDVNASYLGTCSTTESAALCQSNCQAERHCVNFIWNYKTKHCCLKNEEQVEKARSTVTSVDPPAKPVDTTFCNHSMPYICSTDHYECLACKEGHRPSSKRCIWLSTNHISGWKHCTSTPQSCSAPRDADDSPSI